MNLPTALRIVVHTYNHGDHMTGPESVSYICSTVKQCAHVKSLESESELWLLLSYWFKWSFCSASSNIVSDNKHTHNGHLSNHEFITTSLIAPFVEYMQLECGVSHRSNSQLRNLTGRITLHVHTACALPITSWGLQGDSQSGVNSIAYLKHHLYIEPN